MELLGMAPANTLPAEPVPAAIVTPVQATVARIAAREAKEQEAALAKYRPLVAKLARSESLTAKEETTLAEAMDVLGVDADALQADAAALSAIDLQRRALAAAEETTAKLQQQVTAEMKEEEEIKQRLRVIHARRFQLQAAHMGVGNARSEITRLQHKHARVLGATA